MHDKEILKFVFRSDNNNDEYELFYNGNDYYFSRCSLSRHFKTFQEALRYVRNELAQGDPHLKIDSITSEFTRFEHV